MIVFIDESGLSERPCRARTWAPRGQTPVLQYSFSWKQLSVIGGVSLWRFYFRLFAGSIRTTQVIEFLNALQATIDQKPELNPAEYVWGYLKHQAMPNYCARDLGLMQRRPTLVRAFWKHAELL